MNTLSRKLLHSFEELPTLEQNEVAAAILRLTLRDNLENSIDEDWMQHAEELSLAQNIELNSIE